ncbi:phage head morphogenesis protein, SPP1 gp7 family [Methanothermococcus okinawensis]|uniref:Phage head morphogenesis protein, SPP1 gp7 family n=1 Tax=Methanothermococcus okinawensis (strain DSM 14208 / JCM 11175 / IH1) TaxID=647113 RepID=F8AKB4_METOI|nr:phage head morphogenesis protein, SPP1 gp7 family [Methanothermococcus okinawensis]AEH06314.1 phage head morphogenesis protein, SPP1 gp7 family [Methanothermococcus okinawensis IH1]
MFFTAVWGHSKDNNAITENTKDDDIVIQHLSNYKRPTTIGSTKYAQLLEDPAFKEMIYKYDATVNLTITTLKNKLFQSYEIIADNDTLKEKVQNWINEIGLINTNLHGDSILEKIFIDYLIYGECFAQIRYKNGEVEYIQRIDPTTMEVKKSPFDDREVYFIQTANYEDLQGNAKSKTIYFVPSELRNKIKTNGAEVGKAENIIWFKRNGGSVIDKCIEYVLAKWDIIRRMPTTIMRYSAPFIHGIVGKFDKDGNPMFPTPPADPNDEVAKKAYDNFKKQLEQLSEEFENWDERKELFTDPFLELKTIEAGKAINPQIYETSISILDKQITYALLSSMALIDARGSELATSRTVADYLNAVYRGMQTDFTALINFILFRKFGNGVKIKFADINPEDTNQKVERLDKQADIIGKLKNCGVKENVIIEVMKEFGLNIEFDKSTTTKPAQHSDIPTDDTDNVIVEELTNKIMNNIENATIAFDDDVKEFLKKNKSITVDNYIELNNMLDEHFKDIDNNLKGEINTAIDTVVAGTGLQIDVNSDAVKFVKNYALDLCTKLTENQKNRLKYIIVSELNTVGDTNITQRIMDTLKTTKADAQRIVETELRRAKTWSENEYYKEFAKKHKGKYKVYVKIITRGDSKVCPICKGYANKEWEINEAPIIPPIHPRCRCTPVYRIEPIK